MLDVPARVLDVLVAQPQVSDGLTVSAVTGQHQLAPAYALQLLARVARELRQHNTDRINTWPGNNTDRISTWPGNKKGEKRDKISETFTTP